jgi:hypothetical protein
MIFLSQATPHFLGVKESEGRTPLGAGACGIGRRSTWRFAGRLTLFRSAPVAC